jgi:hypothetical protein
MPRVCGKTAVAGATDSPKASGRKSSLAFMVHTQSMAMFILGRGAGYAGQALRNLQSLAAAVSPAADGTPKREKTVNQRGHGSVLGTWDGNWGQHVWQGLIYR